MDDDDEEERKRVEKHLEEIDDDVKNLTDEEELTKRNKNEIIPHQRMPYFTNNNNSTSNNLPNNNNDGNNNNNNATVSSSSPANLFQPRGFIELPYKFEDGKLLRQSNVRGTVSCHLSNGHFKSKLFGSSLVRGPIGASTGTLQLSYDVLRRRSSNNNNHLLQAVSQVAIGDQSNIMAGTIYHRSTAWYGIGMLYHPTKAPPTTLQFQTEQRSTKFGQVTFKINCPTSDQQQLLQKQLNASLSFQPNKKTSNKNNTLDYYLQIGVQQMSRLQLDFSVTTPPGLLSKYRKFKFDGSWRSITGGLQLDANLLQACSPSSAFGIGVRHHNQRGLSWLFTWIQGGMTIKVPIFILKTNNTTDIPIQNYLCSSLYLGLLSFMIQEVLDDLWNVSPKEEGESSNNNNATTTTTTNQEDTDHNKARSNAEKQRLLMIKQATSRRQMEIEKQGLVITKAMYYIIDSGGDSSWDVTTQLQFWTHTTKSTLTLPALPKQNLLGFYDIRRRPKNEEKNKWWQDLYDDYFSSDPKRMSQPESSNAPLLAVQYDYAGVSYEIIIQNDEPLSLPSDRARVVVVV